MYILFGWSSDLVQSYESELEKIEKNKIKNYYMQYKKKMPKTVLLSTSTNAIIEVKI